MLGRLYLEVGNGGFGPGYGIYGLQGGFADDQEEMTLVDLYLNDADYDGWPKKLVNLCDWGCNMASAIDCSVPGGEMVFIGGIKEFMRREGISFHQWMEDWVKGIDLFRRGEYGVERQASYSSGRGRSTDL